MKFNKLTSTFAALFVSTLIAGCGGGSSDNAIKPTKAMYDQIKLGMNYTQVVGIVGGEAIADNGFASTNRKTWNSGSSSTTSSLIICLPNNAVSYKLYRGTETGGTGSQGLEEGNKATCI